MLLSPNTGARTRGDVLITGATGFLGMELMARLLEHGDRRVWALVRAPDEAGAAERLHSTPSSLVPDLDCYLDRVVPIAGDLTLPGLGARPAPARRARGARRRTSIGCSSSSCGPTGAARLWGGWTPPAGPRLVSEPALT